MGWEYKVNFVLLLIAELNIFWGIFNLFPLLPLDGGHIAVVIWERLRAWFARLRGCRDPGPVDYRRVVPVMFGVFAVIVVFTLVVIVADIVNPVDARQLIGRAGSCGASQGRWSGRTGDVA